ncbi:unnamed protein product [Spirodela intermedia]|uniref:Expansin-like EG45 domain-containing protein n=1 Tax=Spirodela intermedia TaxID=51605 RepID=A0A7I8JLS9_SPIIN|nr:unnamed protein product [Spirodela intermedia]CAA6670523.1 unnamed protein product [Spirodela intermedia]
MDASKVSLLAATFILADLLPVALAATGTATFYNPPYVPSACYGNQNKGVMIAAASDAIWGNRAACGRKYRVTCTGVVVTIVDYCPPGCQGTIDLSRKAFSTIANLDAGKIQIRYNR